MDRGAPGVRHSHVLIRGGPRYEPSPGCIVAGIGRGSKPLCEIFHKRFSEISRMATPLENPIKFATMTPRRYATLTAILDRRQTGLTVLVDDLQKAHNVSAVIRTCDAVGVPEIHAVTDGQTFKAKVTSSAGSSQFVDVQLHTSYPAAVDELHRAGFKVVAAHLDPEAVDFRAMDFTQPTCIVLGQEGPGVTPELLALCDHSFYIPMAGAVESLNVSVAAAVTLFEAQRQRQAVGLYDRPQVSEATRQRLLFEWGYKRLSRWYRQKNYPYPRLGENGEILDPVPRG